MSNPSAQPFLDAIRAAPEDDAPRLIYADWLDEQGDESSRDRAAFIRAQCAAGSLWQTSPAPASEVADRDAISRAEETAAALRRKRNDEWKRDLHDLGLRAAEFDRGLIAWASTTAANFLAKGSALVDRCPGLRLVQIHVEYRYQTTVLLERLLVAPAIRRLPGLQIVGRIGDLGAERIAGADFAGLTRLNLSDNGIGDRGATALAESRRLPKLTYLDLSVNSIAEAGKRALEAAPFRVRLTKLILTGNPCERTPATDPNVR